MGYTSEKDSRLKAKKQRNVSIFLDASVDKFYCILKFMDRNHLDVGMRSWFVKGVKG